MALKPLEVIPPLTRDELYATYGDFTSISRNITSNNNVTVGQLIDFTSSGVPYGFRFRTRSISFYCSFGCRILGYISQSYAAGETSKLIDRPELTIPNGGGTITIPWALSVEFLEGGMLNPRIVSNEAVTGGYSFRMNVMGEIISSDMDTDADMVAEIWGDSITWTAGGDEGGLTIPNLGDKHYFARICEQLKKDGLSIWRSNKGFGGATAKQVVTAIRSGYYGRTKSQWSRLKLLVIGVGTNDALTGNATSTNYSANLKFILDYVFRNAPGVAVLLMGQTPTDTASRIPNLPSYRTVMQSMLTDPDYTGKEIRYVDTTVGFDVITANFTETVAGERLHPRWDTGGLIMYNQAYPVVQQFSFYIYNT